MVSHSVVGGWGKNLAIRVPVEVARAVGRTDGEKVEIEAQDGDLVVHRWAPRTQAWQDAEAAAEESSLKAIATPSAACPFGKCWTTDGGDEPRTRRLYDGRAAIPG